MRILLASFLSLVCLNPFTSFAGVRDVGNGGDSSTEERALTPPKILPQYNYIGREDEI